MPDSKYSYKLRLTSVRQAFTPWIGNTQTDIHHKRFFAVLQKRYLNTSPRCSPLILQSIISNLLKMMLVDFSQRKTPILTDVRLYALLKQTLQGKKPDKKSWFPLKALPYLLELISTSLIFETQALSRVARSSSPWVDFYLPHVPRLKISKGPYTAKKPTTQWQSPILLCNDCLPQWGPSESTCAPSVAPLDAVCCWCCTWIIVCRNPDFLNITTLLDASD